MPSVCERINQIRARQEVLSTHKGIRKKEKKSRALPSVKWSRRRNSKACVFFSFFILVGRLALAGSCGRLGGGRASSRVSSPSGDVSAAQEEVAGIDSQALIQWRIPSLRRRLLYCTALTPISPKIYVRKDERVHTMWCDHHTSAHM